MKTKSIPVRRCAGCMESKPKKELIRIAGYLGEISIDTTGRAKGRGVYVCPVKECIEKAQKKKAIGRSLDMDITPQQINDIFEGLKQYEKED